MNELLTPAECAAQLGIAKETLCRWRLRGDGPPFIKQGRWVRYRAEDVAAFLNPAQ